MRVEGQGPGTREPRATVLLGRAGLPPPMGKRWWARDKDGQFADHPLLLEPPGARPGRGGGARAFTVKPSHVTVPSSQLTSLGLDRA